MNRTLIVVPSWSRLAPDMEAETGCRYAAFIPLGGKPLYRHLLARHAAHYSAATFVFVLAPDAPALELDPTLSIDVREVRLEHSGSIGETVIAALQHVQPGDAVAVHMADTLLDIVGNPAMDAVYAQRREDLYRWTSVVQDADGRIHIPQDRDEDDTCGAQQVCVGLFTFSQGQALVSALQQALSETALGGMEPFFVALQAYAAERPMKLVEPERWFDCGHVDTYYESRLGYQNLRHFNSLSYEPLKGQVTKRSIASEAFRHQVRWFKQVPDALASYLPRIFDSSDGAEPFISMELLSIPTLGELFVSGRLNVGAWNGVVRNIAYIQQEFAAVGTSTPLASQLARVVYLDKSRARIDAFLKQHPEAAEHWIAHEGERWTLSRVQLSLERFVEASGLLRIQQLTPIHGDFCFSNLLYDSKVRLVKMIDPRGEFGVPGIFGDRRYDLAKLAHSYAGGYDFIVADRFQVELSHDAELLLNLERGDYHQRVKSLFERTLLADRDLREQVNALQALLFLSMLPLHVDAPDRQLAMLATGLRLYAQSWTTIGGAP